MITMMGSMGTYMKNLKLQTQFQIKQDRGELGSHKSLEDYINITNAKDLPGHENDKDREKLSGIKNKLLQGGKLTLRIGEGNVDIPLEGLVPVES